MLDYFLLYRNFHNMEKYCLCR